MPVDPEQLTASLETLRTRAEGEDDTISAIEDVANACVRLFDVTGSGIMVTDERVVTRHLVSADEWGRRLEIAESETGEGPCTESFVHQVACDTPDLRVDPRWPRLASMLRDTPVRAVLGVPVRLGGVPVGTLDVYRDSATEWDDEERSALGEYAAVIGGLLGALLAAHRSRELAGQLQYALDYRVVIERGVGFLMATEGVDAVAAFNLLRAAARSTRTKIGQVAEELMATGRLPGERSSSG